MMNITYLAAVVKLVYSRKIVLVKPKLKTLASCSSLTILRSDDGVMTTSGLRAVLILRMFVA